MTTTSTEVVPEEDAQGRPAAEEPAELSTVLETLGNATCRTIYWALGERKRAMTAQEIASTAHVSLTSTYRKLDQLTEAGLVTGHAEVDPDGQRRSRYRAAVDLIEIEFGSDSGVDVQLFQLC